LRDQNIDGRDRRHAVDGVPTANPKRLTGRRESADTRSR
jgi:hypothetical protein